MKDQALPVPVFDGQNYDFWSIKMTTYFKSQDLWETVKHGVSNASSREELREDARALFTIQQALTDRVFPRIYEARSAKEAWDILKMEFRGGREARAAKLRFYQAEFDGGARKNEGFETGQEYYSRLRLVASRIRYYGGSLPEEDVFRKLLQGLPEAPRHFVNKLVAERAITVPSARELIGCLEAFEMRPSQGGWSGEDLEKERRRLLNQRRLHLQKQQEGKEKGLL